MNSPPLLSSEEAWVELECESNEDGLDGRQKDSRPRYAPKLPYEKGSLANFQGGYKLNLLSAHM